MFEVLGSRRRELRAISGEGFRAEGIAQGCEVVFLALGTLLGVCAADSGFST